MGKFIDLTGQRFGMLLVLKVTERNKEKQIVWMCKCDCGNETTTITAKLKNGHTKSCGCFRRTWTIENKTKHGHNKVGNASPESIAWSNMIQRCTNPKSSSYKDYGGRGISVTSLWLNSFENFLEDMGNRPSPEHSIDRIDVNGNYEPSNCRWATKYEQARNKRLSLINRSGHRGVFWNAQNGKWMSQITASKNRVYLGLFDSIEDAIEARKQAEIKYWGKSS